MSTSLMIELDPALENAHTPYSFGTSEAPKERVFEDIRQRKFKHRPSRSKALFVFDDYDIAKRAQREWFSQQATMHECRCVLNSKIHKADSTWLHGLPEQWPKHAEEYWQGTITSDPFLEIVVHGRLYFPEWESFPLPELTS